MRSLATKFITVTAIVVAGATVLTPASHAGSNNGDAMAPSNSVVESNMFDIEAFLTNDFDGLSGNTRDSLSKTVDHAAVTDLEVVSMPGVSSAGSLTDFEAADPEIVADGVDIYLYSTNTFVFGNPLNLPVRKLEFPEWKHHGDAMPKLGSWAEKGNTWAPGVHEVDGRWVVYYTARVAGTTDAPAFPAGEQCIGVALGPVRRFVRYPVRLPARVGRQHRCFAIYRCGWQHVADLEVRFERPAHRWRLTVALPAAHR